MFQVLNKSHDPAWNLALEEHLLDLAGRHGHSFVMFWRNAPAVIVGRFQNTAEEVNEGEALAAGVKVIRRASGGGAVYHDLGNLNYSFLLARQNLAEVDFRSLAGPILSVLRRLGVPAEFSGRNDLAAGGRKISGTAQWAGPGGLLHHGTLLYDVDLERLSRVLQVDPAKYQSKGVKSARGRVANLKDWLPQGFTLEDLEAELVKEIGAPVWALTEDDLALTRQLKESKYDAWEWTWGRSPEFTVRKEKRFPWGRLSLLFEVNEGLIREARIFGDFFSPDLTPLETALRGLSYNGSDAAKLLRQLPGLVAGATGEDIEELLKS